MTKLTNFQYISTHYGQKSATKFEQLKFYTSARRHATLTKTVGEQIDCVTENFASGECYFLFMSSNMSSTERTESVRSCTVILNDRPKRIGDSYLDETHNDRSCSLLQATEMRTLRA